MKRLILCACAVLFVAAAAQSDTATATVTTAGAAGYSAVIPASGWLDRVEIVKSSDNDVVDIDLATWSGTTAVQTFVDINALATSTDQKVVIPRTVGTTSGGTALTAAGAIVAGASTNAVAGTVLVVPYEKYLIGGNLKLKVGSSAGTNATVTATLYYERLPR